MPTVPIIAYLQYNCSRLLLKLSHLLEGQPYYNDIFGVHGTILCYKRNCVIMKLFTNSKMIIPRAMTWPCYIENHTIVRHIIMRLNCIVLFTCDLNKILQTKYTYIVTLCLFCYSVNIYINSLIISLKAHLILAILIFYLASNTNQA